MMRIGSDCKNCGRPKEAHDEKGEIPFSCLQYLSFTKDIIDQMSSSERRRMVIWKYLREHPEQLARDESFCPEVGRISLRLDADLLDPEKTEGRYGSFWDEENWVEQNLSDPLDPVIEEYLQKRFGLTSAPPP